MRILNSAVSSWMHSVTAVWKMSANRMRDGVTLSMERDECCFIFTFQIGKAVGISYDAVEPTEGTNGGY